MADAQMDKSSIGVFRRLKNILIHSIIIGTLIFINFSIPINFNVQAPVIYSSMILTDNDSYCSEVMPDTNYGTVANLAIYNAPTGALYAFIQFNLSNLPDRISIINVSFMMNKYTDFGDWHQYTQLNGTNASFDEDTIVWNNMPSQTDNLGTIDDDGLTGWFGWDTLALRDYVSNAYNGDKLVTLCTDNATYDKGERTYWRSKEAGGGEEPRLWIFYTTLYFESEPITFIQPSEIYNYSVITSLPTCNLTMNTTADWLMLYQRCVLGVPQESDIGTYIVRLNATDVGVTVWQNYTLDVAYSSEISILNQLLLYLIFFVILLVVSFISCYKVKMPILILICLLLGFSTMVSTLNIFDVYVVIPMTFNIIMSMLLIKTFKF